MKLTQEQQNIIKTILSPQCNLLKINAVSGAGKSSTLVEIAKALSSRNGLYMAYNKAIATEAEEKFHNAITCKTIHSLAYGFTVKHFNLKLVGNLKPKIITERMDYLRKSFLLDVLKNYFLSRHIVIQNYIDEYYPDVVTPQEAQLLKSYFIKMKEGQCECSHDFYLKLFHIFLHHKIIKTPKYDLLMLDEAGDVNGASLEIFRLLESDKKVMVGDNQQNIYSFNQTINGFEALEDEGVSMTLSQSFRVSTSLAPYVEDFCHAYLDPSMVFKGVQYDSMPAEHELTHFYLARTNGGIIEKLIELEDRNIPYNLTRKVKDIFQLPLILLMISKDHKAEIFVTEYKFLEHDASEFDRDPFLQQQYNDSLLSYIAEVHADDASIMASINLIVRFGPQKIYSCNKKALEHEKHHETHKVTVTSVHSSKGLQADIVHILPDMNGALNKVVAKQHDAVKNQIDQDKAKYKDDWVFDPIKYEFFDKDSPNMDLLSHSQIEEFRLYYVAVTRAKYTILNADWLSEPDLFTSFSSMSNRGSF